MSWFTLHSYPEQHFRMIIQQLSPGQGFSQCVLCGLECPAVAARPFDDSVSNFVNLPSWDI